MNTVSGQWMVFVAGWQCFFGATRSSSTARIHRAPPSFPLPRSSSTPSPLLPLPKHFWNLFHSFQQFLHPVLPHKTRNDLVSRALKAPLPHPAQADPAPPSLHLAQVRHRPGRHLEANFLSNPVLNLSVSRVAPRHCSSSSGSSRQLLVAAAAVRQWPPSRWRPAVVRTLPPHTPTIPRECLPAWKKAKLLAADAQLWRDGLRAGGRPPLQVGGGLGCHCVYNLQKEQQSKGPEVEYSCVELSTASTSLLCSRRARAIVQKKCSLKVDLEQWIGLRF